MKIIHALSVSLCLVTIMATNAQATGKTDFRVPGQIIESRKADFILQQVAAGYGVIWGMAFLSDDKLIFTERQGWVSVLNVNTGEIKRLSGLPDIRVDGQGGLLDVAVPNDFQPKSSNATAWIYFTYVKEVDGQGVTVLARAKLKGTRLVNWQDMLVTDSGTDTGYHFGSRIAFDETGHVYFGIGDRGERANGQDLTNHAATIMRLNRDGKIPADNPFVKNNTARPEIWSYGHRNPQGLTYDIKTKRLWSIEHGPRGGDEINLILPGRNYGWPVISYGKEYFSPMAVGEGTHKAGMEQPVKQYTPSIAPGSLLIYSGKAFPAWQGNLFAGALKLRHLNRVVLNKNGHAVDEERLLGKLNERVRALVESPQGWIYFSTDSGKIIRLISDRNSEK